MDDINKAFFSGIKQLFFIVRDDKNITKKKKHTSVGLGFEPLA
jgi:hypothetical protein